MGGQRSPTLRFQSESAFESEMDLGNRPWRLSLSSGLLPKSLNTLRPSSIFIKGECWSLEIG